MAESPIEHDQTDGGEDVVLKRARMQREIRAQNRDRRAEQHAERQRPAFIEGRENQEDEEQRETEDGPRWNAFLRLLFLEDMPE